MSRQPLLGVDIYSTRMKADELLADGWEPTMTLHDGRIVMKAIGAVHNIYEKQCSSFSLTFLCPINSRHVPRLLTSS